MSAWLALQSNKIERAAGRDPAEVAPAISLRTKLLWLLLPMVGAMQLSAVTEHMTTNIAAIPLLWIIPLATYLLTFVLAFQSSRWIPLTLLLGVLAVLLYALGNFLTRPDYRVPVGLSVGLFDAELFVACLVCHSELYRLRPGATAEAARFYLTMAAGGAAGSFLVGVAAPMAFRGNYDLSLTFVATAAVVLAVRWRDGWKLQLLWGAATLALAWFCFTHMTRYLQSVLMGERNFYGSLRVKSGASATGDDMRTLMHGSIVHGTQVFSSACTPRNDLLVVPIDCGLGTIGTYQRTSRRRLEASSLHAFTPSTLFNGTAPTRE